MANKKVKLNVELIVEDYKSGKINEPDVIQIFWGKNIGYFLEFLLKIEKLYDEKHKLLQPHGNCLLLGKSKEVRKQYIKVHTGRGDNQHSCCGRSVPENAEECAIAVEKLELSKEEEILYLYHELRYLSGVDDFSQYALAPVNPAILNKSVYLYRST